MDIVVHIISTVAYGLILLGLLIAVVQEYAAKNARLNKDSNLIANIKREIRYPFYIAGFILLIIQTWIG